jgi:hypothetical protein
VSDEYPNADVTGTPFLDAEEARLEELRHMDRAALIPIARSHGIDPIGLQAFDLVNEIMAFEFPPGEEDEEDSGLEFEVIQSMDGYRRVVARGDFQTESASYIFNHLLPRWAERFLQKNADYQDQHRYGLGPKGEFVGLDRKMAKL